MLYEVVTRAQPIGIDGAEFLRRLPQGLAYMRDLQKQGVILSSWVRVGGYGAINIFSVDTHEDLLRLLYGNPLIPHITFEVTPLIKLEDFEGLD